MTRVSFFRGGLGHDQKQDQADRAAVAARGRRVDQKPSTVQPEEVGSAVGRHTQVVQAPAETLVQMAEPTPGEHEDDTVLLHPGVDTAGDEGTQASTRDKGGRAARGKNPVKYEVHEAANLLPLDEENIPALAKDIKEHGQTETIKLLDGKILDGRRRYKACQIAGVEPKTETVATSDPAAYVVSLNILRRHMSKSQRAMFAVDHLDTEELRASEAARRFGNDKKHIGIDRCQCDEAGRTSAKIAAMVGVSSAIVERARAVRDRGADLANQARAGDISVDSALRRIHKTENPPLPKPKRKNSGEPSRLHAMRLTF